MFLPTHNCFNHFLKLLQPLLKPDEEHPLSIQKYRFLVSMELHAVMPGHTGISSVYSTTLMTTGSTNSIYVYAL